MVEIESFPNNQDEYIGAENVMKWLHGRTSGVFGADGNCAVTASGDGMTVNVSDGVGWISNSNNDGVAWWINTEKNTGAKLNITVDMSDGVLDRIDRVVVSWETTNYVARPTVSILKGTASSTPAAPELTNNNVLRQISLAQIYIAAGTLSLTNAMITDERLDPDVCGIVTYDTNFDTSVIQAQFEELLKSIQYELSNLESGTGVELKKLLFRDTVVPVSAWVDNTEPKTLAAGYVKAAQIALSGVVSTMIPSVTISVSDAVSGNYAPVAETYYGGIWIYAITVPDAAMTIPTIICWKGDA